MGCDRRPAMAATSATYALPNLLTFARIAAVPIVVACLIVASMPLRAVALAIFIGAAATDWLDGYLARRMDAVSTLGRMLDPIADKLIVAAVLMMLVADATVAGVHVIAAVSILIREIFISGMREFFGGRGIVVPVTPFAKWKTTAQLVAIAVLIAWPIAGAGTYIVWTAGIALLWVAAAMTVWTGVQYAGVMLSELGEEP